MISDTADRLRIAVREPEFLNEEMALELEAAAALIREGLSSPPGIQGAIYESGRLIRPATVDDKPL